MARIFMLRSNPYRPDPAVRRVALALKAEGHDILLSAWDREDGYPRRENQEGIEIRRVRLRCSYDDLLDLAVKLPLLWLRMLPWLLREGFEVVHAHDLDTLPLGLFVARLKDVPCVFHAHELYSAMVTESVPPGSMGLLRWVERVLVRSADLVITVNDTLSKAYGEMGARKTVVVMNSTPREDLSRGDPASVRRALGLEGKKICLYLGMLERSRNLDRILELFGGEEDNFVLVIGGHGSLVDLVRQRASESKNVVFVGWIDPRKLASYLAAAEVVLLLDDPHYPINRVATPTRLLEAMALGIPVLASEGTATAEIVRREGIGLAVGHDDVPGIQRALHELLFNENLRDSMARKARRASEERYNWDLMKRRLIEAYGHLRSEKVSRTPGPA